MAALNSPQLSEVSFVSGLTAGGSAASQAFWTWNNDDPATYGPETFAAKWGSATPGTGATITFRFDTASNWSTTERAAFVSSMKLWSSVADIAFVESTGGQF